MTTKLTDTQRTALEAAAQHPKGHIELPKRLRGGALTKTLLALKAGKLAVYKRGILTITDIGRAAVGASVPADRAEPVKPVATREGTKQAQLIALLRRPKGVTVPEAAEALEWEQHTVRGAMAGALKKRLGLTIESEKVEGRGRAYRIAD
ncbi:MAG: DUF3489 domain-containing protein [Geminicoccaceae bacterium]